MATKDSSPKIPSPTLADMEQDVITVISSENSPTTQQPPPASATTSIPSKDNNTNNAHPQSQITESPSPSPPPPPPSATAGSPSRSPPPGTINMTSLRTALPDIALNSPSTNIIGTPFAHTTSNTPFEYPFPDTPPSDSASPPTSHSLFRPGSPHGTFIPPPHPNFHPPPPPPPPAHPTAADIHSAAIHNHNTTFNLIHPKFRAPSPVSPPPMPPSLKKKRWSLNILGRKRTSNPSTPVGDITNNAATTTVVTTASSPPGSPPVLTSGAILGGLGSGRPNRSSSGGNDPYRSIDKY